MIGWIKLHRSLLEWEWYSDHTTFRVFVHLLLNANYEPSRFLGYDIPVGALATGRLSLSEKLGISERNVRTALEHLKTSGEVTIKRTPKFSIITMTNWAKYQSDDQQPTSNRPATDQQPTTSKKGRKKEVKISLAEWEAINGKFDPLKTRLAKTYSPDELATMGMRFVNSCEASGRKYVNFNSAFCTWDWPPPKQKPQSGFERAGL